MIRKCTAVIAGSCLAIAGVGAWFPASRAAATEVGLRQADPADMPIASAAGGTWAGIHSSWARLEPRQGQYAEREWQRLEQWTTELKASGKKVLLTMSGAPNWATGRTPGDTRALAPLSENIPAYARMLGALATRLGGSVDAWTTWNEPNIPMFMDPPSPDAYMAIQAAGYDAIKAVRPQALVLAGPFAGRTATQMQSALAPYLRLGLAGKADVLAWNTFPATAPWKPGWRLGAGARATYVNWAGNLQAGVQTAQRARRGWPLWITEFGRSTCTDGAFLPACVSPAQQAIDLVAGYRIMRRHARGIRVALWYTTRDVPPAVQWVEALGLVSADGTPKPSFDAFRTISAEAGLGSAARLPKVLRAPKVRTARIAVAPGGLLRLRFSTVGSTPGRVVVSGQILNAWQRISTSKVAGPASVVATFADKGYARLRITVVR